MKKILIIDDSDIIRHDLGAALVAAGYAVVEAVDGLDALEKVRTTEGLSLLITDYNMPGMDGLAMVKQVREIPHYRTVPIFILTTEASLELRTAAKAVGVKYWAIKPINTEKMLQAIQKIVA